VILPIPTSCPSNSESTSASKASNSLSFRLILLVGMNRIGINYTVSLRPPAGDAFDRVEAGFQIL
jgi:hypothetical protein